MKVLIKNIRLLRVVFLLFFPVICGIFTTTAQTHLIKGLVSDERGNPLSGVVIREKGTNYATISLNNGSFEFSVTDLNAVLTFTLNGFETREDSIKNREFLSVTLFNYSRIDTVVVKQEPVDLGFYSLNKDQISSSVDVYRVKNDFQGSLHFLELVKQLNGVNAIRDGSPTGYFFSAIRGNESVLNEEPLYVVDGIVMNMGINLPGHFNRLQPFTSVNPQDIRSIKALKSNAATGIYGSQGANGVILVETKNEDENRPFHIKFALQSGINIPAINISTLENYQYVSAINQSLEAAGKEDSKFFLTGNSIDWYDELINTGFQNKLSAVLSGKMEKSDYYLSASLDWDKGMAEYSDFNNKTLFFKYNREFTNWFKLNLVVNTSGTDNSLPLNSVNRYSDNPFVFAQTYPPFETDLVINTPLLYEAFGDKSPNEYFTPGLSVNKGVHHLGKVELVFDIAENLRLNTAVTGNYSDLQLESMNFDYQNQRNVSAVYNWYVNNYLTYKRTNDRHEFMVLAGSSESFHKLTDNVVIEEQSGSQENLILSYVGKNSKRAGAQFLHINYVFNNRFDFSAGIRREKILHQRGTDLFGMFPFASAGTWLFKNAWQKNRWFSGLKLKAGWGISGADRIFNPHYVSLTPENEPMGSFIPEEISSSAPAPNSRWEMAEEWNFGIQTNWLNNAFKIYLDYFDRIRSEVFFYLPETPETESASTGWEQSARIKNSGWELQASFNKNLGDVTVFSKIDVQSYSAMVLNLGNGLEQIERFAAGNDIFKLPVVVKKGEAPGAFTGYVFDGIFQSQQEVDQANSLNGLPGVYYQSELTAPGDIRFKDLDGNGLIDENDITIIGNPAPDYSYGITLGLEYGKFDLSARFDGKTGNQVFNLNRVWMNASGGTGNRGTDMLNSWTQNNPSTTVPRLHFDDPNNNNRPHSGMVEDASFFRLSNLELGFTYKPNEKGTTIRPYISIQNFIIHTQYEGMNPEAGIVLGKGISGLDYGQYPAAGNLILGIQFDL